MRNSRSLLAVVVIAALLLGGPSATHPQTPLGDCEYFVDTGHYVCGEFLEFYKTRGGVEIFGYPLTEACEDPTRGLRVQYFQRARMEWHPSNPDPYKVQLGLLFDELANELDYSYPPARPEQIPPFDSSIHHYFPETGHVVSYAFLKYFREKGGLDVFGYPRSEFLYEDGYIVQYFQRARMEWHPEIVSGPQMHLTNLGKVYIDRFGVPEGCDELPPGGFVEPTKLDVTASVRYVITGRRGTQTVFVYANDQRQEPVAGAAVRIVIHYQSGDQVCEFEEPTDASGFTRCSFDIRSSPPGRKVVIDVTVTYGEVTGTTQTFFLPWW